MGRNKERSGLTIGYAINADKEKVMDGQTLFHRFRYHLASGFCTPLDVALDLGCGTGYGSAIIAEKAMEVRGFDMEQSNIDAAIEKYQAFNIHFKRENLESLKLPKCDVAVCFEVIEHLYDPKKFVAKMKRSASQYIIVSVPLDQKLVMVDGDPQEEGDSTHHSVFTESEFMSMFVDEEWKVFLSWRDGVTLIAIFYK